MKPVKIVLPEKYSERNIVSTFMGVINEYVTLPSGRSSHGIEEQVFWSKFENIYSGDISSETAFPLVLSIGTCKSFYLWGLSFEGKAHLLYSERNASTIDGKLLPSPQTQNDLFSSKRPIIALCGSFSRACCQWQVRFVSLLDNKAVQTLYFESRCISLDATTRFVLVARVDCMTVISANSFQEYFTINCSKPTLPPVCPLRNVPFALGSRWLAFADSKPVYHHLSRCGDASSSDTQPLTSTVMNMNKRIWSSLSALANTVVSGPNQQTLMAQPYDPTRPQPPAQQQVTTDTNVGGTESSTDESCNSPGYVTIVDIFALRRQYDAWKRLENSASTLCISDTSTSTESYPSQPNPGSRLCGTAYINVYEHCDSGSVVAHFMAHRWANVALLKFDATGSLLFTACTRGHSFNVFRISNHPGDVRQTAVHHLYILERGTIPCEVLDATFSNDSRWIAVSTNHGTTHVFPITPYGGLITVRTHTRPCVVNRTSRYHRSSGLEEHHLTRPQRERTSADATVDQQMRSTQVSSTPSTLLSGGAMCRGAPMAGLSPQCPHLGFPAGPPPSSPACLPSGSSEFLSSSARPKPCVVHPSPPTFVEGACACPLNAHYNTANPRLPPYPEPCVIKPEARLRPHNPGGSTTGAAAAALEAVTSSAVSTAGRSATPTQYPSPYAPAAHPGPCVHNPSSEQPSFHPYNLNRQPLPVADPFMDNYGWPLSGPTMAARFAPPICFLPSRPRPSGSLLTQKRDPYGGKSRPVDGLFILTTDLYLVEYDLNVVPTEQSFYGDKLYQDGTIRLECVPVGEWNLRNHTTFVPPFPKNHPFLLAANADHQESGRSQPRSVPMSSESVHTDESQEADNTIDLETVDKSEKPARDEGVNSDDASSYWYSQVEVTTHLGPLRRMWMGPQFTFRTYSKLPTPSESSVQLCTTNETEPVPITWPERIESLRSAELTKMLTPCVEPFEMSMYYRNPKQQLDPEWPDGGSTFSLSSRSSPSSATLQFPDPIDISSPLKWKSRPLPTKRFDAGGSTPVNRWRNCSGEVTRPISISGTLTGNASDPSVYIEGGSYQDSSLGGSLSSLVSRSGDDVASCIAEAIQDAEACWPVDKTPCDSGVPVGHPGQPPLVNFPSDCHFPVSSPMAATLQSALTEADFPSQEASPELLGDKVSEHVTDNAQAVKEPDLPESGPDAPDLSELPEKSSDIDRVDGTTKPEVSQPIQMNSRKAKRTKKGRHKLTKQATRSAGEVTPEDRWNDQLTTFTGPLASGYDSLSCSPAVDIDIREHSQSVDSTTKLCSNVCNSTEMVSDSGSKKHARKMKTAKPSATIARSAPSNLDGDQEGFESGSD